MNGEYLTHTQPEFLGQLREFTHGTLAGLVALHLKLHQIVEPNPSTPAGSVVGQRVSLEQLDEVRLRDIQQVGGFRGRQFGIHEHNPDGVARGELGQNGHE